MNKLPLSPALAPPVSAQPIPSTVEGKRSLYRWLLSAYDERALPPLPCGISPGVTLLGYDGLLRDAQHELERARLSPQPRLTPDEELKLLRDISALRGEANAPAAPVGSITVVNIRERPDLSSPDVYYIGRANPSKGLPQSPLANPHRLRQESQRDAVCAAFESDLQRIVRDAEMGAWGLLCEMAEKVAQGVAIKLVCWCAPKRCHGDAIAAQVMDMINDIYKESNA